MDLRNSYYCVSIPGETEWVKNYEQKPNVDLEAAIHGTVYFEEADFEWILRNNEFNLNPNAMIFRLEA